MLSPHSRLKAELQTDTHLLLRLAAHDSAAVQTDNQLQ